MNESALWTGRTVVYSALLTLFTHSGVTQWDLLVLKSTHLQSFQSGKPSAEEKRSRFALSSQRADDRAAEKLLVQCAKRCVFTQRAVTKRCYAHPYRAFWLFGPQQAATGWLQELHGAAAACLSALFPGSGSSLRVWLRLQGPPLETLRFLLVDDLFH